jgi:hypothetical protein
MLQRPRRRSQPHPGGRERSGALRRSPIQRDQPRPHRRPRLHPQKSPHSTARHVRLNSRRCLDRVPSRPEEEPRTEHVPACQRRGRRIRRSRLRHGDLNELRRDSRLPTRGAHIIGMQAGCSRGIGPGRGRDSARILLQAALRFGLQLSRPTPDRSSCFFRNAVVTGRHVPIRPGRQSRACDHLSHSAARQLPSGWGVHRLPLPSSQSPSGSSGLDSAPNRITCPSGSVTWHSRDPQS